MPLRAALLPFLLILVGLAGCAGHRSTHNATPTPDVIGANVTRGKAIFEQQCAACHGAQGVGGQIGPSLRDERDRHTFEFVRGVVLNPAPPMPKLYPGRLTLSQVRDVSAYVESL